MEPSASGGVRLFRPWAEYIIRYRLVKLVQVSASARFGGQRSRLSRQDFTLAGQIILALDTSSKATSLAVARGATLLSSIRKPPDEKRSDTLWTDVKSMLAELGMTIDDIDVFAVCVGPGGFTGLRVGMAAVKGFAAATNKAIIGVTSLEAAACAASPSMYACAMVNAYKGEVYSQLFLLGVEGLPVAQNEPIVSTLEDALDRVADVKDLVFAGDGAEAGAEAIESRAALRAEANWATKEIDRGVAEEVARLACMKDARGDRGTAESLKACYVSRAEAEIKLSLGLLGSKIKRSMNK